MEREDRVSLVATGRIGTVVHVHGNHVRVKWDDDPHGYCPWLTRRQLAAAPEVLIGIRPSPAG